MAIIIFLILIPLLIFGGIQLSRNLRGIDFRSVAGALLGFVIVIRFLIYSALALPVFWIMNLVFGSDKSPDNAWITTPVKIQFTNPEYSITSASGEHFNAVKIAALSGDIQFANPDLIFTLLTVVTVILLIGFTHFILINAQYVLKTLYDKTPFAADNSTKLKKVALFGVLFWLTKSAFTVISTIYLQSQLTTDGIEITLTNIRLIGPLVVCGLILVLAEVFRIGFELKEENELTV